MLSERLTADDFKVIAEENSVLKQSLVSMEEQLEEAERKTELTIKIIERVQQLEDKHAELFFTPLTERSGRTRAGRRTSCTTPCPCPGRPCRSRSLASGSDAGDARVAGAGALAQVRGADSGLRAATFEPPLRAATQ